MSADGTGLIDPDLFPFKSEDMDPGAIENAASGLKRIGTGIRTTLSDLHGSWAGLREGYHAPEQERVYGLMDQVPAQGGAVEDDLTASATQLETFATTLATIKPRMAVLEEDARIFRQSVAMGVKAEVSESSSWQGALATVADVARVWRPREWVIVPWNEATAAVARNTELLTEHANLVEQITTASGDAFNAIKNLVPTTVEDVGPINAEQLLDRNNPMPWGAPVAEGRNAVESAFYGGGQFVYNFAAGAAGLAGFDASNDWDHSSAFAWQSITAMGNALGSLGVTVGMSNLTNLNPRLVNIARGNLPPGAQQWLADREEVAHTTGADLVGIDYQAHLNGGDGFWRWREDAVATGTESALNVGSMFVPTAGPAGLGVRIGLRMRLLRIASGGVDFVIPGTSLAIHGGIRLVGSLRNALRVGDDIVDLELLDGAATTNRTVRPGPGMATLPDGFEQLGDSPVTTTVAVGDHLPPATRPLSDQLFGTDRTPDLGGGGGARPDGGAEPVSTHQAAEPAELGHPDARNETGDPAPGSGIADDLHLDVAPDQVREVEITPEGMNLDVEHPFDLATRDLVDDIHDLNRSDTDAVIADLSDASGIDIKRGDLRGARLTATLNRLEDLADTLEPARANEIIDGIDELRTALANERESRISLTQSSTDLGEGVGRDVYAWHDWNVVVDNSGAGRNSVDIAGVNQDMTEFIVGEVKGGDGKLDLHGRQVGHARAPQGSTDYLSETLSLDKRLHAALEGRPEIGDRLRSGDMRVRYVHIEALPDGRVRVHELLLNREALDLGPYDPLRNQEG